MGLRHQPTETELDQLIAACGRKTSTYLQLLKETGMRCGEAARLKWVDVDLEKNTVAVNSPEKHSNARILKVSNKLIAMLNAMPKTSDKVFGSANQQQSQLICRYASLGSACG